MKTETDSTLQPLVSIAMCTYNGERFLREQLDSLIAQDYPNLEIVINDDRSTDSTFGILQEYAEKYPHIQVILNETNLGLTKNFEKAISQCTGAYIALCDQDDVWFPEKISTLVKHIGKAALIYTPVQMIDEDSNPLELDFYTRRNIQPVSGKCSKALVFDNCILGHTTLFKRALLTAILPFPKGIPSHDQWISIIAATLGEIQFYDQILSRYRMHRDNAALKNRGAKKPLYGFVTRRIDRNRRIRKKHRKQQSLLNALADLKILPEEDRQLFGEIAQAYSAFYRTVFNRKLAAFINQDGAPFLAMQQNKEKALKKICRGYLAELAR